MNMIELYKSLLGLINHHVDDNGYVHVKEPETGVTQPAAIEGRDLALPVEKLLVNRQDDTFFFHPLKEDIRQGTSPVLEYYRKHVLEEISSQASATMVSLLVLANDKQAQKTLRPEQSEALDHGKTATADTATKLIKIFRKANAQKVALIHIYLRRGGKDPRTGEVHSQFATVTFPLYEAFKANPANVLGEKLTKNDQKAIDEVFQYVFPGLDKEHQFSYGSNSLQAPKLDALMGAMRLLLGQVIAIADLLSDVKFFADVQAVEDGWMDHVGQLENFRKEVLFVPMQAGNEGTSDQAQAPVVEADLSREHANRRPRDDRDDRDDRSDRRDRDDRSEPSRSEDKGVQYGVRRLTREDVDEMDREQERRNREAYDREYERRTGRARDDYDDRRRRGRDDRDDRDYDDRRSRGRDDRDDYDDRRRSRDRDEERRDDRSKSALGNLLDRAGRSRSRDRDYDDYDDRDDRDYGRGRGRDDYGSRRGGRYDDHRYSSRRRR